MTLVSRKFVWLFLLVVAALPSSAATAKRRSVAPSIKLVTIRGRVTDTATGAPVAFAQVANDPRTTLSDADGNYEIDVPVGLRAILVASRSGYEPATSSVVGRDSAVVDFKLKSKPTVTMRLTNGTTYQLDPETAQFAQEIPFSNAVRSDEVELCKPDGSKVTMNKSEIAKITGPAVSVTNAQCCTLTPVLKLTFDYKNGQHEDAQLAESCTGVFMDFAGRNHTTGQFIYTRFQDIQEVVFP